MEWLCRRRGLEVARVNFRCTLMDVATKLAAPLAAAGDAVIAIGVWEDFAPLAAFSVGSAEYPDRSATLITEMESLVCEGSDACRLTGPGIRDFSALCLPDAALMQANAALFPLGLDFILTSDSSVAALPRSTKIEVV